MATDCFVNREISWLHFNERVLENAEDEKVPLCERMNFLSIYQSNLDEFFMVRIGSLHDQMILNNGIRENKTGMSPSRQISAALKVIQALNPRKDQAYAAVLKKLKKQNIRIVRFHDLSPKAEKQLGHLFTKEALPFLSYYKVAKKTDFPFLNDRQIYAIALLGSKGKGKGKRLAVIPCNGTVLNRLIPVPDEEGVFVLLEEFILHYMDLLLNRETVLSRCLLRVTRNADIDADAVLDEEMNYREHMSKVIKQRKRLSPVRAEMSQSVSKELKTLLQSHLRIKAGQIFETSCPMDLSFLYILSDRLRNRPELFYEPRGPKLYAPVAEMGLIDQIREKDLLFHYPYDSFNTFLRLLHEAAFSDRVRAIRMTLYRLARDSKVAEALAQAAENGKKVEVFVELKARFDEENNIEWSRRLERAGCRVIYGIEHIKVHSKLCLLTCVDEEGKEYYITQIGTGNYNEKTSRIYTDFSLMTARQEIGQDSFRVFRALTEGETVEEANTLLVSPHCMEEPLTMLIDQEIEKGEEGLIRIKMNSLTDLHLMDKLIEASRAGVNVEMIVRGICCLKPGIKKRTEHVRIISIVGRYLEHSRIYLFGKGDSLRAFISSADWMTRNMERRVEIGCPVQDKTLSQKLETVFDAYFRDTAQCWELNSEGKYLRRVLEEGETAFNAQDSFYGNTESV